jgi:hypothetical protein
VEYTQRDFLYAVLSQSGLPCIAYKRPSAQGMQHKVFESVQQMADYFENAANSDVHDYYFCISTLLAPTIIERGSKRVRTQTNASHTRCFVLDLDVHAADTDKEDRYYHSQDEAREGLARLVDALDLPAPIVVNSGYGLHVYWPMVEGVPSAEWKQVAERFKRTLNVVEPRAVGDGTRVADSAGVLRVPDTNNLKNNTSMPVYIEQWSNDVLDFGEFARKMETFSGGFTVQGTSPGPQTATPLVNLDIAREELEPVELKQLIKNCNWVQRYLKSPEEADEPQWYAMLGLAAYTIHTKANGEVLKGRDIAHLFSSKHPEYTDAETDKKFTQAKMGQTGPTTCQRMWGIKASGCEGCPFIDSVRSPASAARISRPITEPKAVETQVHTPEGTVTTETVFIPVPPKPYFRGDDGGVYIKAKDDDGDAIIFKIYDHDIYPVRRYRTENIETEILEVRLHLPHDGMRTFKMPTELLADMKRLNAFLSSRGVVTEVGKAKHMTKYMVDYIRDMQMNHAAETEFSRFGWRDINSPNPKFVVGNGYISKQKSLNQGSFAYFLKDAARAVAATGDLAKWKAAFNVYLGVPDSEPYQIAALLGFAAPLLALTEYSGVLYNMVGASGAGKSTALQVMTSVWGQPNESHIRVTDNEIPMYNFIGYLNSIPVAFDELTKMEPDRLGKFVLNFTGGRGKMRATRNGTNALNEVEWDTIVACTSNTSLYSKLAESRTGYTAEAMRVYEVNVPISHAEYKPLLTVASGVLKQNYGLAGRVYAEWLMPRLAAVGEALGKSMTRLDEIGHRRPDERFWVAFVASIEIGGTIAKKLGLHDYDVAHLVRWASDQSVEVRADIVSTNSSPMNVLSDFFNNTLDGTLYFRENVVDMDIGTAVRTIKTRIEYKGQQMYRAYISVSALREFCKFRSIDYAWMKRGLMDLGVVLQDGVSKRLAAGTSLPNTPTRSWEVDMTKLNDPIDTQEKTHATA